MLLSAIELREEFGVETDITDAALEEISLAEERAIYDTAGELDVVTEIRVPTSGTNLIELSVPATTITSVHEDKESLLTDDYELVSPKLLQKTFGTWHSPVKIVYTPAYNAERRMRYRMTVVQLVKLFLAFSGYRIQLFADGSGHPLNYQEERTKLLQSLTTNSDWTFV